MIKFTSIKILKYFRAGEMAQELRMSIGLPEDLFPTPTWNSSQPPVTSVSEYVTSSYGFHGHHMKVTDTRNI